MSGLHNGIISPSLRIPAGDRQEIFSGGLAERSKAAVLKTVEARASRGSNPWPTAIYRKAPRLGADYAPSLPLLQPCKVIP